VLAESICWGVATGAVEAGRWQAESISAPSSKITKMRPIFLGIVILQSFIQMLKIEVQALCQRREEKTGKLALPELPNFGVDGARLS